MGLDICAGRDPHHTYDMLDPSSLKRTPMDTRVPSVSSLGAPQGTPGDLGAPGLPWDNVRTLVFQQASKEHTAIYAVTVFVVAPRRSRCRNIAARTAVMMREWPNASVTADHGPKDVRAGRWSPKNYR